MTTIYYVDDAASDLSVPGDDFDVQMITTDPGTGDPATIRVGVGVSATSYAYTASGLPGTAGITGAYTVEIVFTTTDSNMGVFVRLHRINSGGTIQQSTAESSEQSGAADRTFIYSSQDLGTWASGDRLQLDIRGFGNQACGNATVVLDAIITTGTRVIAPWTASAPAGPPVGSLATMGIGR